MMKGVVLIDDLPGLTEVATGGVVLSREETGIGTTLAPLLPPTDTSSLVVGGDAGEFDREELRDCGLLVFDAISGAGALDTTDVTI